MAAERLGDQNHGRRLVAERGKGHTHSLEDAFLNGLVGAVRDSSGMFEPARIAETVKQEFSELLAVDLGFHSFEELCLGVLKDVRIEDAGEMYFGPCIGTNTSRYIFFQLPVIVPFLVSHAMQRKQRDFLGHRFNSLSSIDVDDIAEN